MDTALLTVKIDDTMEEWITIIDNYSFDILLRKPGVDSWSLGQVLLHIVVETGFYMKEMDTCLQSDENIAGQMTAEGKTMFEQNSFPNIKIQRDASLSQLYPQPESKSDLHKKMKKLKGQLNEYLIKIDSSKYGGKTRHPGLGYFNAKQWLQFAEMHMRHHLRQIDRIKDELNLN